jgi:hypothetical protein
VGPIKAFRIHPKYEKFTSGSDVSPYDVGLVEMLEVFPLQKGLVWPKQIYRTDEKLKPGTVCMMAGFGYTRENDTSVARLHFMPFPILENKFCTTKLYYELQDNVVCFGAPKKGSSGCDGDSGVRLD